METMVIATAQTVPKKRNIEDNLNDHYRLIELAANHKSKLIVFPELSLTGYEREEAEQLSFTPNDSRLTKLRELAVSKNLIIIVGAPLKLEAGLHIGSFVINPNNTLLIYTKQFLHQGEEEYFIESDEYNPQIALEDELISLAICADIVNPSHPANAHKAKSTMYITSIFYSPKGITEGCTLLEKYVKQYSLNVLMSNYGGESWRLEGGGRSSFWTNSGELKASLRTGGEGLVIATKRNGNWTTEIIE